MKKIISIIALVLLLLQMLCFPTVLAETGTTTALDTEVTTTLAEVTTEATTQTTTAQTTTEGTTETTDSTTVNKPSKSVATHLIILEQNGKIAARLTDQNGSAVAGVLVNIQLGSTSFPSVPTDSNGYATFRYDMPTDNTYIYCSTEDTVIGDTVYTGTAASAGKRATMQQTEATTKEDAVTTTATTTASTTKNATTKKTTSKKVTEAATWYTNTATTAIEDAYVAIGFNFNDKALKAFDITEEDFLSRAKLLLSPNAYTNIMGDMSGTLLMSLAISDTEITDEQLTDALKDDPVLSLTNAQDIDRMVIDMTLKVQSPTGKQTDIWTLAADTYVVQLPIPHSMRSMKTIAVSAVTDTGISEPIYATVSKNGFLRFETTAPAGTLVVLGFKNNLLAAFTSDAAITAIIFGVFGLLCIGGAIFLYIYFFFLPKRAKKKEEQASKATEIAEDNDFTPTEEENADIFEDIPLTENNERMDPLGSLDIFADTDLQDTPTHKPHSDIDIPL